MITHFNHVAQWVANMVLIRDKAKHRAPCLQKFMEIAVRLRQHNNYNGLAAVLAGINGTAVHRLAATRALVDPDVQKRFARLELLLGTQKSHFAYRLAWENSPLPRIPFMPLHRRDLVSAEEGSRTFVGPQGDRINWKKFEVLGEVLLPLMKSQGTPYPNLKRHELSRELILDCRMPTDDEVCLLSPPSFPSLLPPVSFARALRPLPPPVSLALALTLSLSVPVCGRMLTLLARAGDIPTQHPRRALVRASRHGEEKVPLAREVAVRVRSKRRGVISRINRHTRAPPAHPTPTCY